MNDDGDYFPLWGTCLGFELITYLSANRTEIRASCTSQSQPLPLKFKDDFKNSRMFKDAPDRVVKILRDEAVTSNFHTFCLTEKVTSAKFFIERHAKCDIKQFLLLFLRLPFILEPDRLSY